MGGNRWELVDGQQRLTTLYLIFAYMKQEGLQSAGAAFSLEYATRQGSTQYVETLDEGQSGSNIDYSEAADAGCGRVGMWLSCSERLILRVERFRRVVGIRLRLCALL